MNIKEKYKYEIGSVCYGNDFEQRTIELLNKKNSKNVTIVFRKHKAIKILAAAIILIVLLSTSVFAVTYFLSAKEVSKEVGEKNAEALFSTNDFDVITISNDEYSVSFHGAVTGNDLTDFSNEEIEESCSYAVFSITSTNGEKLSLIDGMPLNFAVTVDGYSPLTIWSLGFSANGLEKDGVLYYLFKYVDLEVFADKNVCIAVFEGSFPTENILTLNENGKVVYNDNYKGFKGIFSLPLDENKANLQKSNELLENF